MDRKSIQAKVTADIIAALQQGVLPWRPYLKDGARRACALPRRVTGEAYQGFNILQLLCAAHRHGYAAPYWMTFHQAQELGGQVRKGEKGTAIIFYTERAVAVNDEATGDETEETRRILRSWTVFNVEQIDGLPERFYPAPLPEIITNAPAERNPEIDRLIAATGIEIGFGGKGVACYSPGLDKVFLPDFADFVSADAYYATLLHELIHATGHDRRCGRDFGKRIELRDRAGEELVAELGAAMLCAEWGIAADHIDNHAAYIESWLAALEHDPGALLKAASLAQQAADYLHGITRGVTGDASSPDASVAA